MATIGLCMICGKPARFTCSICGRLVCREHYDPKTGVCTICAPRSKRAVDEKPWDEPMRPAQ